MLVGGVLLWEVMQFVRFKSEMAGFLEASEAAFDALGDGVLVGDEVDEAREVVGVALKEELAQRLMTIYVRNRFFWPFSWFLV